MSFHLDAVITLADGLYNWTSAATSTKRLAKKVPREQPNKALVLAINSGDLTSQRTDRKERSQVFKDTFGALWSTYRAGEPGQTLEQKKDRIFWKLVSELGIGIRYRDVVLVSPPAQFKSIGHQLVGSLAKQKVPYRNATVEKQDALTAQVKALTQLRNDDLLAFNRMLLEKDSTIAAISDKNDQAHRQLRVDLEDARTKANDLCIALEDLSDKDLANTNTISALRQAFASLACRHEEAHVMFQRNLSAKQKIIDDLTSRLESDAKLRLDLEDARTEAVNAAIAIEDLTDKDLANTNMISGLQKTLHSVARRQEQEQFMFHEDLSAKQNAINDLTSELKKTKDLLASKTNELEDLRYEKEILQERPLARRRAGFKDDKIANYREVSQLKDTILLLANSNAALEAELAALSSVGDRAPEPPVSDVLDEDFSLESSSPSSYTPSLTGDGIVFGPTADSTFDEGQPRVSPHSNFSQSFFSHRTFWDLTDPSAQPATPPSLSTALNRNVSTPLDNAASPSSDFTSNARNSTTPGDIFTDVPRLHFYFSPTITPPTTPPALTLPSPSDATRPIRPLKPSKVVLTPLRLPLWPSLVDVDEDNIPWTRKRLKSQLEPFRKHKRPYIA
ncbi:hypothetical protein BV22DRAFT_106111 [Leucogyrophana mollusca]|uniref:Uncharacterized protein n=1 Tax=Leucogyrophana mollusca TaxID=85980 RepID=A0ACB8BYI5_9AGAM|nr:hypothetical protein BV22DRAFT_106111 [Leucogyrophana mollusca]